MHNQKTNIGMSSLSMLALLLVVVFFALCAFKITPLYYNNMMLASALEGLDTPVGSLDSLSTTEIRTAMDKSFQVNAIEINARDVVINRDNGKTTLVYDYEARTDLFANISVVVAFETRYPKAE